jgi:hypothetical protein
MNNRNPLGILLNHHLDSGFDITIDDHVATMTHKGKLVDRFTMRTSYEDMRDAADRWLEWERAGIKNTKEETIHGNT